MSGDEILIVEDVSEFSEGMVLDLPHAFVGQPDESSDFGEGCAFSSVADRESFEDDCLFGFGEVGAVLREDFLERLDRIASLELMFHLVVVASFHFGVIFRGEVLAIASGFGGESVEAFQDRPAAIGGEFEASCDVEFFDAAKQGHISFADEFGEVDVGDSGSLGHRDHEGEIGGGELASSFQDAFVPDQHLSGAGEGFSFFLRDDQFSESISGVVVSQEQFDFLGSGEFDFSGSCGVEVGFLDGDGPEGHFDFRGQQAKQPRLGVGGVEGFVGDRVDRGGNAEIRFLLEGGKVADQGQGTFGGGMCFGGRSFHDFNSLRYGYAFQDPIFPIPSPVGPALLNQINSRHLLLVNKCFFRGIVGLLRDRGRNNPLYSVCHAADHT